MFEEPYRWTEAVGNRRAYVEAQFAHGSPVVAVSYRDGIVLATFQRGIAKLYEIYDRIGLGGMGHPADLETLRAAALDMAHVEGFNRAPSDVTAMRLIKHGLAPIIKRAYEEIFRAPLIAKIVLVQLGGQAGADGFVTIDYDGVFEQTDSRAVLAASPEIGALMLKRVDRDGTAADGALDAALRTALRAWAVGDLAQAEDREPDMADDGRADAHLKATYADRRLEVAVLDRRAIGGSKYRTLTSVEVAQTITPWLGNGSGAPNA